MLADAIGIELLNYGFTVVDTEKMTSLMARLNLTEVEMTEPENLRLLASESIDAILLTKSSLRLGTYIQSVTAKIILTENGELVAGTGWTNKYGMNITTTKAAPVIAKALSQALRK